MEGLQITSRKTAGISKRRQPKSRSGCLRCKTKRLKCDETKPACHQCSSRKAQCPGYAAQPFIWSTRHEKTLLPESNFVDEANHTLEDLISNAQKAIAGSDRSVNASSPKEVEETDVSESIENDIPPEIDNSTRDTEEEPTFSPSSQKSPSPESAESKNSLAIVRERLEQSSVPEFMVHLPTELVHHYFSQVCKLFSAFDGPLNPFRTTISKLFQSSAPIYYAIQGMAAAYLSNHFPRMSLVGTQMQQEAYRYLAQNQLVKNSSTDELDKILLTMLLIGPTSCWYNASDLGLRHLNMAKRLNKRRHQLQRLMTGAQVKRQNEFFDQCILYWEMLTSFVVDRDELEEETDFMDCKVLETDPHDVVATQIFPHPWAGVKADVQKMFCKVGRLIRRFREETRRTSTLDFLMLDGIDMLSSSDSTERIWEITLQAQSLEEKLLSCRIPPVSNIIDAGDESTTPQHYVLLAEAFRCAALLEIYRVFPTIFHQRSPLTTDLGMGTGLAGGTSQQLFDNLHSSNSSTPSEWLTSFAIHILSLLEQIPATSGTRCLQPLIVVVAAAELRFPISSVSSMSMPIFAQPVTTSVFSSITEGEIKIAHKREFVMTRMQEFKQYLPAKPFVKAEQLIQETWARLDLGQDVFWMDVMQDLHCESLFG